MPKICCRVRHMRKSCRLRNVSRVDVVMFLRHHMQITL